MMPELSLMASALQDSFRPRRLLPTVLLLILPAVVGLLWKIFAPAKLFDAGNVYDTLVTTLVLGFALPILSVLNGTGVVAQELEQRTIVYLLTRPIARWRILLSKWAVCLIVVSITTILSLLLLAVAVFGLGSWGKAGVVPDIRALAAGTVAYSALFLLLGALLPRPLTYGLLLVFGWESWVPTLPGSFARLSIMTYVRILAARDIDPASKAAPDVTNPLSLFAAAPKLDISAANAGLTLGIVTLVTLVLAIWVFSKREYAPREDAA